ncbi:Rad52 22 double-strand break repair protein [Mycena metata]|uniref:Rad52 22 double-strand break repair protein n=1 Tax=Mycena metata TaxID=1033252 RepID=A0AAD7J7I4_9AGAR|nr:Rad52 22 double-strand break repair protein [Mycena metata]
MSESTYDPVNRLQTKLNQKFGPEFISQRPGPSGGPKLTYAEAGRRHGGTMRVTLKEGVFHEDVGYGMFENAKAKGMALDKCEKEAVTEGLKRTLRTFGSVLGNCLYDKQYTKIKVPPIKLEKSELTRI